MSSIFVVFPGAIPDVQKLESLLTPDYKWVPIDKVEALSQYRDEKGVVLLGGDSSRVNTLVGMIRSIAPKLGCVVALEPQALDTLDPAVSNLVDFLRVPYQPLEVAARINTALHLSELRHLIETSAQLDEVTELYHYQYFIKRLGEEMSLAKRHLSPLTCVILSLHYYDMYRDSYGHQFVFNLLKQCAQIIQETIRQEDIVARLGDNEIAILLPHSTEKGALSLTQRIVKGIEQLPVHAGEQAEKLSLCVGIAGYPTLDEAEIDPDTLIRYARHALHTARCSQNKKIQLFTEMKPFVG